MLSSTTSKHRHAHGARVVQNVALVLDVFDDGDENARIALPEEYSLDVCDRISTDEVLDFAVVVGEDDHGNIQAGALHLVGQLRGGHVADGEVGDDQIEAGLRTRQSQRLGAAGNMRDAGNLLQVEFEGFVDEQLVEAAVFAQDERIVEAGDQKDVLHLERHQVVEAFEAGFGIEEGLGDGAGDHIEKVNRQSYAGERMTLLV